MSLGEQSLRPAQADDVRKPEFFVVGHPKCGTTAIYEMLRQHPQVYTAAGMKGTEFFRERQPQQATQGRQPQTLEEYLALFAPAGPGQRTGEFTTSYLRSADAARGIAEVQPAARIIALFREPASFLRSLHLELVRFRVETELDFRKALELEPARREGRMVPDGCPRASMLFYSDFIRYTEQLSRYHEAFPREQVLALIYDDFRRDNLTTMRQVLRFIGVDDLDLLEIKDVHASVRVRSTRAQSMLRATMMGQGRVGRAANAAIKRVSSQRQRQRAYVAVRNRLLFAKPHPPDHALTLELRRRFKPEVEAFGEYMGRDLATLWGYNELA